MKTDKYRPLYEQHRPHPFIAISFT